MSNTKLSPQKSSREEISAVVSAIAAAVAAIIMLVTVIEMHHSAADAEKDAEQNRTQQRILFQGVVMSSCMNEYFQIIRETSDEWSSATPAARDKIQDQYSEEMYGLHFEEYHLFQRHLIPQHVYAVWLRNLKEDSLRTNVSELPKLDIKPYTSTSTDQDFHNFINKALSSDKIDDLVSNELVVSSNKLD